jgi:hypothetical protein
MWSVGYIQQKELEMAHQHACSSIHRNVLISHLDKTTSISMVWMASVSILIKRELGRDENLF